MVISRWIAIALVATSACTATSSSGEGRPSVVAAIYPLAWVAEQVGAGDVEVEILSPPGAEPHDIELSPRQVGSVVSADLLLFLGEGFQPAVEDAADPETSLDVLTITDAQAADPHVWLDPIRMIEIVRSVEARLSSIDGSEASEYEERAEEVIAMLESLDDHYASGLENCGSRVIVVSHAAFGYLADRYGLEQIGIAGLDPEAEPSPQRVADVAELARSKGVTTIFFERLVSPDIAETIAAEIGVSTAVLDPIESAPEEDDYISAMERNLVALRSALECA